MLILKPIETAPKDGTYILLFGDSGYATTPLRCVVCHYDAEYRPLQPWVTHSCDSFEDGGGPPLYWCELPVHGFKMVMCKGTMPEDNYKDFEVFKVLENETDEEAFERAKEAYSEGAEFYIKVIK